MSLDYQLEMTIRLQPSWMSIAVHRGFKRLGWIVVVLCLPVVVFVSYQESQQFAGFSGDKVRELYPKLLKLVDESDQPLSLSHQFSADVAVAILTAERNGTLEQSKRDGIAELRRRGEFPYAWEVDTQRLDKTRFAVLVASLEAGLVYCRPRRDCSRSLGYPRIHQTSMMAKEIAYADTPLSLKDSALITKIDFRSPFDEIKVLDRHYLAFC